MVKIVRHKSLTVDGLRDRLKAAMAKPQQRPCPTCHGEGQVNRPLTQDEVSAGVGLSSSQFYAFVNKGKSLSLDTGLRLLSWLDEQERTKLDELDDAHEPRDPDQPDPETARIRAVREVSSRAAATAAIDARERPLQLIQPGGGVMAKPDRQLSLGQLQEVRRAMANGGKAPDLARAYGVSVRTVYRACEGSIEEGEIGGHKVVLQIREGQAPIVVGRPMEVAP